MFDGGDDRLGVEDVCCICACFLFQNRKSAGWLAHRFDTFEDPKSGRSELLITYDLSVYDLAALKS
jgi:hypothetical protein